jgi:hypothetical protein
VCVCVQNTERGRGRERKCVCIKYIKAVTVVSKSLFYARNIFETGVHKIAEKLDKVLVPSVEREREGKRGEGGE